MRCVGAEGEGRGRGQLRRVYIIKRNASGMAGRRGMVQRRPLVCIREERECGIACLVKREH